jgi:fumarate hydratase class II
MQKLPNSKRSKIGRTHLMDATPLTVGQAFWLCGTVKLWFEGGKNTLAHLSEVALWNCSRHRIKHSCWL